MLRRRRPAGRGDDAGGADGIDVLCLGLRALRRPPPARNGVAHPAIAPYGQYLAGDGKPVIFGLQNDREWQSFCAAPLSREQALARLDRGGIANSALNTMHEVWDHPQFAARGRWRDVATPGGPIKALLPPATLSGAGAAMGEAPTLGQHTDAILQELGLDASSAALNADE